jgi:molybdopterin synthase catalytic subunit
MGVPLTDITTRPLRLEVLLDLVSATRGVNGAVTSFLGLVRSSNAGRQVLFLEYEAYEPLALRTLQRIVNEAHETWPGVALAVHHRIGRLEIGEVSVAIAAGSPHRSDAFAACRYAIERVKQIAPIWKREHFEGGQVWIEGATANPDDAVARERALKTACV